MTPSRGTLLPAAAACLLAAALAIPTTAAASTLLRLDLPSLVANSPQVVRGEVTSVDYVKRDGRVFTDVQVNVEERWKGNGDDRVTLRLPGGRDGEMVTRVHGVPHFRADERVVLFLTPRDGEERFLPTGLVQGKFHVERNEDDVSVAVPQVGDAHVVAPDSESDTGTAVTETPRLDPTDVAPAEPAPVHRQPVPVGEMKRRVHELLTDGTER